MEIMVCYDGSKIAEKALYIAKKHARSFDAKVHVVTFMMQNSELSEKEITRMEKAELELEAIKSGFADDQIPCQTYLLVNNLTSGEALIQYANKNKIDQIILGVRKRSKVGKLVFGSTVQHIILEAPCTVVVVK